MRLLFALPVLLLAQETSDDARTRRLWNEAFNAGRASKATSPARNTSRPVPAGALPVIGLTLWRMERAQASDQVRTRGFEHGEDSSSDEWTPVRIPLDTRIRAEDWIRITIESARTGFLYLIDRDVYEGGSAGESRLIFPTSRISSGRNDIGPGRPLEIPQFEDRPPAFRVKRTRTDQAAVELLMILSPVPLPEFGLSSRAQRVDAGVLDGILRRAAKSVRRLDNPSEGRQSYTAAEREAAAHTRPLTVSDPAPKTLFGCACAPDEIVAVPLRLELH